MPVRYIVSIALFVLSITLFFVGDAMSRRHRERATAAFLASL
jgi:hypothetical protein